MLEFPQERCYVNKNDIIYINNEHDDNKDEYSFGEHKNPNTFQNLGIPKSHWAISIQIG